MELNNLKVENFRSIDRRVINPGKINVIHGPNGAGKSSVLEAISFLLTGKAGSNIVKEGTTEAIVSANIMGVPILRKGGAKAGVKMNGKTTTAKSVNQFFESAIGTTPDTVRVASSAGMLAAMNSKELASFLMNNNLIPADIDMDVLTMLCTISAPALAELEHMLPPAPNKFTMTEIEEAYKHYYSMRPAIKKLISEKMLAAENVDKPPMYTQKQIDDELAKYSAHAAQVEAYNRMMKMYVASVEKRKAAYATIEQLDAQINACAAKPVDPNELTFLTGQRARINEELLSAKGKWQTVNGNLSLFRRTLDSLDRPICPISNKLVCTTDKTAIRQELTTLVERNQSMLDELTEIIQKCTEHIRVFESKIKDYYDRQSAYNKLEALLARRSGVEANIPEILDKPIEPTPLPNSEERIATLKEQRQLVFLYEAALQAKQELPALQEQLAILDELCDVLNPKGGVREKIIAAAFEPLLEHCNERAKMLKPDFQIGLVADDGIHITCKPKGAKEMLPIDAVSAGEQLTTMLLILDAINALSGLGLLVLDDLDKLDATALDALFTMLEEPAIRDGYDHIFIAMVNHEDSLAVINKHSASIDVVVDMA